MKEVGFSVGRATMAAGTFSLVNVFGDVAVDANAQPLPPRPLLDRIEVNLTGLAAPNNSIEAKMTWDVAGDEIASNVNDPVVPIVNGETTATDGGGVVPLGGYLDFRRAGSVPGQISVWLNIAGAGAPVATVRLFWVDEVP